MACLGPGFIRLGRIWLQPMKKLLAVIILIGAACYFYPGMAGNLPGLGGGKFGISADDPLGSAAEIERALKRAGFPLKSGSASDKSQATYTHPKDESEYPDFGNTIKVWVGDEAYIYRLGGSFVSTQHGLSPARITAAESFLLGYWQALTGSKPKFGKATTTVSELAGIKVPHSQTEALFNNAAVSCKWMYSESHPVEVVDCSTK